MTRYGRLLPFAMLAALLPFSAPAHEANGIASDTTPAIAWTRCASGDVEAIWIRAWGDRLQCGRMRAPLDYDNPTSRSIDIGLVRVTAAVPAQRQGAIFFNFGGPGLSPLNLLPETAALFQVASPSHPVDGDKRRIAERFDLVAVVPRGLKGGTMFSCPEPLGIPAWLDTTVYLADWNWAGFLRDTRSFAQSCSADATQWHMGTWQHVRDMERARVALGEPLMHYFGTSYGTYVGVSYAATYPTRTGRFVLDSVMDYSGSFEAQLGNHAPAKQRRFEQVVLRPAMANPAYGIGTDATHVMARFRAMPTRLQGPWQARVDSPAQLAAMLTLADWVRAEMATWTDTEAWEGLADRLLPRIAQHAFSADPTIDDQIRYAATRLASPLRASVHMPSDNSMYYATVCGDSSWHKQPGDLRRMANAIAARYPAGGGAPVTVGLICHYWRGAPRPAPPLAELTRARPMLMVQAEFDPATPLDGATNAFGVTPDARMVVARGMSGHGVFGLSATPCIERAVGRFLLTGELPADRLSECAFVPEDPHARPTRGTHDLPPAHQLRERLREALRDS